MGNLGTVLEFVKIEHTLFALPFVLIGMLLGFEEAGRAVATPEGLRILVLVLAAAVSARTLAMTLNRIVDRDIDARNPRTAGRALPAGALTPGAAYAIAGGSTLFLAGASYALNFLCFALSPVLVGLFFLYPYMKRWTWSCHFVLGLAFLCAPAGGYLAVTASFAGGFPEVFFGLAAFFWVAGFDVIYALLDLEFDRANGVFSVPAVFGEENAKTWAAGLHALTVAALAAPAFLMGLGWPYWVALAVVAALLVYEHALARSGDAGRINKAFFNMNAGIGWIVLAGLVGSLL